MNGTFRFFTVLCSCCLCCIIVCMALAAPIAFCAELETEVTSEPVSNDPPATEPYIVSEEVVRNVSPVTPSDANGFKAVLLNLLGNYETVVTEHRYTNTNGYTSISVSTEPDYAWIISAAIFAIVIFCLFRILGGVICGRK